MTTQKVPYTNSNNTSCMHVIEQRASLSQCDQLAKLNDSVNSQNIAAPNSSHESSSSIMQASNNNSSTQVGNSNSSNLHSSKVPGIDLFVELPSLPCVAPLHEVDLIEPIAPTTPDMQIENTHSMLIRGVSFDISCPRVAPPQSITYIVASSKLLSSSSVMWSCSTKYLS
ncbi:hypothetical protein H5410_016939 [Solanum commersonii]|uniref:Uncharacterized protein n=1 Tax=Solanum commersonii TaxID=4109 RepID=A0A9J5ZYG5_SOLCO|nr:hypothetical protein H5410_016939 [Solanum commersonii]